VRSVTLLDVLLEKQMVAQLEFLSVESTDLRTVCTKDSQLAGMLAALRETTKAGRTESSMAESSEKWMALQMENL